MATERMPGEPRRGALGGGVSGLVSGDGAEDSVTAQLSGDNNLKVSTKA